jgi:predicted TIM-barrel fold metal-dependent hydrolase
MSDYTYVPENAPVFTGNYPRSLAENDAWLGDRGQNEDVIDPDLPIVDAHHHLWDNANGRYLLHEIVADIRGGGHRVLGTVHVEAHSMLRAGGPAEMRVIGETEFIRGIAAMSASGGYGPVQVCAGIVGRTDFRLGDGVARVLDAHIEAGGGRFRGIRQNTTWLSEEDLTKYLPHAHDAKVLDDPQFRRGFAHLAPRDLSFDSWIFHPQLDELTRLARDFPGTRIIMNHVGGRIGVGSYAFRYDEEFARWRESLRALARQPNTYLKIGGLGMVYGGFGFHTLPGPLDSAHLAKVWEPFVLTGIEAFGPDRCIMESNFPVDRQACSYRVLWNALKRIVAGFSAEERLALFYRNARCVYRLNDLPEI